MADLDPRLGKFSKSSGEVEAFPSQDVFGKPVDRNNRPNQTVISMGNGYFVYVGSRRLTPDKRAEIEKLIPQEKKKVETGRDKLESAD